MITITNNSDSATIQITGEIGSSFWSDGWTLERFNNQVKDLNVSNIVLEIDSKGGDLLEAFAIYDAIKRLPSRVTAKIVAASASAATVIASAADRIEISENSRYLVHNAQTFVEGNKEALADVYEQLASFDEQILNIYAKRTGQNKKELAELMKQEKWMTAAEALEWGFVDAVIPAKILNQIKTNNEMTPEETAQMEALTAENEQLKMQLDEAMAKLAEYEAAEEMKEEEMIDETITEAIKEEKLDEEVKDLYKAIGKSQGIENLKKMLNGIKKTTASGSSLKDVPNGEPAKPMTKEQFFANWKSGLYVQNVEKYRIDFKAVFNKEPKI